MTKCKLHIKPLSVNQAWQGKRYKTNAYKKYERDCLLMLPKLILPKAPYQINIEVAFSTISADIDNVLKPMLDILQKKYNFDDKHVYRLVVEKKVVKKGNEYIAFEISGYEALH